MQADASNITCLERRCKAVSSRTGEPCRRWAILGGRVCPTHGGSIKRVKQSAQQRLAEMVDPALTSLAELVESADSDGIKLAAIKDVLDRAGFKPKERIEQSGKLVVEVVYGDIDDDRAPLLETPALSPAADQM